MTGNEIIFAVCRQTSKGNADLEFHCRNSEFETELQAFED